MTPDLDINDQIGQGRIIILTPPRILNWTMWALVTKTKGHPLQLKFKKVTTQYNQGNREKPHGKNSPP